MELAQEIYLYLKDTKQEWPEHALSAMRDSDGEVKFSSNTKGSVPLLDGIYIRGVDCMINCEIETAPSFMSTSTTNEIISRNAYEDFYYGAK